MAVGAAQCDPGAVGAEAAAGQLAGRFRLAVGRLSRQLNHQVQTGLTMSQWSALLATARCGPWRVGDLAAHEHVSAPTLTRVVAGLEGEGLVQRQADPTDARASLLIVTAKGQRRLDDMRAAHTRLLESVLADVSDEQRDTLAAALPVLETLAERLAARRDG